MTLPKFWLQEPERWWPTRLLAPLAALYRGITALRRQAYERDWLDRPPSPVPVIVVGNIFVGGTGKTPFVAWLAETLRQRGHRPGIVARGYGGRAGRGPRWVAVTDEASDVGDEPLLLAQRTGVPVYVGSDRPAAVRAAADAGCTVVISDDGLQHYRMRRVIEIVVLDAERRLGNRRLLPAGPLREPPQRLDEVHLVAVNGGVTAESDTAFSLVAGEPLSLCAEGCAWPGGPAHAVVGIGNPERFRATLEALGIEADLHVFPDHHAYQCGDLAFGDTRPIIMTEKDAVKCRHLPGAEQAWFVPVSLAPNAALEEAVDGLLTRCIEEGGR